jgi:hypothetical protein
MWYIVQVACSVWCAIIYIHLWGSNKTVNDISDLHYTFTSKRAHALQHNPIHIRIKLHVIAKIELF